MAAEFIEEPIPDLEPEHGALIEADDNLELSKMAYYQACYDFADRPSHKTHKVLERSAEHLANTFADQLSILREDTTSYEFMVASCNAVTMHGRNRVDALNAIMEDSPIGHSDSEIPKEEDWDVTPDQEEGMKTTIFNSALQIFTETLSSDTNNLVDYVAESTTAGKRAHIRDELINHGIDIGKIALGTAVGLVVAKLMTRKSKS